MSETTYPVLKVSNGWRVRDGRAFQLVVYPVRGVREHWGSTKQRSIGWVLLLDGGVGIQRVLVAKRRNGGAGDRSIAFGLHQCPTTNTVPFIKWLSLHEA